MVSDPDLGSIAASIEDGQIVSVGAADPTRPNVCPYAEAADLAAREEAALFAAAHPEAPWIAPRLWDACVWQDGA